MIISFVLSAMMLAALGAGLALRRRAPVVGAALSIAAAAGLYFVWMPDHLSAVAHAMGVGRGTDLLLYLWVSLTMLAFAGLVLELRHLRRQLTLLARELALQHARGDASIHRDAATPDSDKTTPPSPNTN